MAYTTIDNPELHFQTVLYTGNATARDITLDGSEDMSPSLVWIKERSAAEGHKLFDAVRGATNLIQSSGANLEQDQDTSLTSFNSDGFSLGIDTGEIVNDDGITNVAWCWKGNGSGSSNEDGTINTTATSANTTAGFSISTYTGSGSGATIGHGLGVAPPFYIVKNRGRDANWAVYHNDLTASNGGVNNTTWLVLNTNVATQSNDSGRWNATSPTSSVVSVGVSYDQNNRSSDTYVAYCWTPIQGFSKFSSYIGNGNDDGTFVYTGFRPAYLMVKNTGGTWDWNIWDNKRFGYNGKQPTLFADLTNAEDTEYTRMDFLSNGFKTKINNGQLNTSGNTYVYMAFAEAPFVNSNGVPCNAR
jgi:hypothetical protein